MVGHLANTLHLKIERKLIQNMPTVHSEYTGTVFWNELG
jgi:hypothetical protein